MKGWPRRQPHLAASSSASFLTDLYVLPAPFFTLRMWFEISWSSSRAEYVVNHNCSGSRSCIFLEQCMSGSHFRHLVRVTQSLVSAGPVVVLLQCALFFKKTKTKGAVQCLTAALTSSSHEHSSWLQLFVCVGEPLETTVILVILPLQRIYKKSHSHFEHLFIRIVLLMLASYSWAGCLPLRLKFLYSNLQRSQKGNLLLRECRICHFPCAYVLVVILKWVIVFPEGFFVLIAVLLHNK